MYNKNKPLASIAESQYKLAKKLQGIEEYEMPKFYKFDQLKLMQSIASSQKIIEENYNHEPGPGPEPKKKNYFYVENPIDKSISVTIKNSKSGGTPFDSIEISDDKENWTELILGKDEYTFDVPAESNVYIRAEQSSWNQWVIKSPEYNVGGNIMSLLYGENFENETTLENNNIFDHLFAYSGVVDASKLILPATTLTKNCYSGMFVNCTSLTSAPALPATTLTKGCYSGMFQDCVSLTTAPELNATTLDEYCYDSMFYGCKSLTEAPQLPATTLANYCYNSMFANCTSLTSAPQLPATTLAESCYISMFYNCTSLNEVTSYAQSVNTTDLYNWLYNVAPTGTFYNLGGATYETGASGIPSGWTEETSKETSK